MDKYIPQRKSTRPLERRDYDSIKQQTCFWDRNADISASPH